MAHVQHGDGMFFIAKDGARVAEMTYSREGDVITIDHTQVDPSLRGQGVAKELVSAAVAWARAAKVRVRAVCPYAKAVLERTPEFRDVLGWTASPGFR